MTRLAIIRKDRCFPDKCNVWCIQKCPVNRTGKECITLGTDRKAFIDEGLCNGCGICPGCPFDAISIVNLPQELKAQPVHRYGENAFALYNLPVPKKGHIVGLLGRNGIGKSTALQILSNLLHPNFGHLTGPPPEDLVHFFKGSEAQAYFQRLKDGQITLAYKPQMIEAIPKTTTGTVRALLAKVDERKQLKETAALLELDPLLDHDIATLSGGELQRVAIAATALKKADVYYFDEPSSYLDIRQRINVAKFLRGLATPDTSVLVVEHDLIVLDYLTDVIHLVYGESTCYGIISQPLASKAGINSYLDGYLKSENVRFRSKRIQFIERQPWDARSGKALTVWPSFTKTLTSFTLTAQPGSIHRQEVLGVLGPNGIGKTTFVKVLAGLLQPDTGKIDLKLKVAYKPQYLEGDSGTLVGTVLSYAVEHYDHLLIRPLELDRLLWKPLNHLSGGELQRVAVALCLSQDADLFLLDEPSAYLDVEQRLAVAKVINEIVYQKGAAALVVDHDLLFLDYLSTRLLVFDGLPARHGTAYPPMSMEDGMNHLLKDLQITLRREEENKRPRINKEGSVKDREQKAKGTYYYT